MSKSPKRVSKTDNRHAYKGSVTIRSARAFFSPARELALLRKTYEKRGDKKDGATLEIAKYTPKSKCRFQQIVAFVLISDDWRGMGETCLGVVHERGWNVHYAHGFVLQERDMETTVFIMALGLKSKEEVVRMDSDQEMIATELLRLGVGRRAKMLLLAKEAKKLALLSKVVEELADLSTKDELEAVTAPQGESAKFFAARTDEYMLAWPPSELARQIITNYRLMEKVRKSGGFGAAVVENRPALSHARTCITVAGLRRDVSVEDCLRVVGDTLGFYEQHHLVDFTTRDGLAMVHLEVGLREGGALSGAQRQEIGRQLREMLAGHRVAWIHKIESRGGFEQYARAIIPFLLKEQEVSGLTQLYISPTTREQAKAGFKIIFVYSVPEDGSRPSLRLPNLLQTISGLEIESVVPPRTMRDQRFFIINIKVVLSRFKDIEDIYTAIRTETQGVFASFRDFDEGIRKLDTTMLKQIEAEFDESKHHLVDRIFYSIDEFSRLSSGKEETVRFVGLGLSALQELDSMPVPTDRPVLQQKSFRRADGSVRSLLLAVAWAHGHGIPSCVTALSSYGQVSVSQIHHGDGELLMCRMTGEAGEPPDLEAFENGLRCLFAMAMLGD